LRFEGRATATTARSPGRLGLSGRLFLLTVAFVVLAEILIYVPAVATYRMSPTRAAGRETEGGAVSSITLRCIVPLRFEGRASAIGFSCVAQVAGHARHGGRAGGLGWICSFDSLSPSMA
jgi:hypothetical protein